MKIPNYISRDVAIHAAADPAKALQTPRPGSPFQVRDSHLKAIRELANIFNVETKIRNRDALPTPQDPLIKRSTKLTSVEYYTAQHQRVDSEKESKNREQKIPISVQTTPPSASTRGKYTKTLKKLVKQRRWGHYTGNKYDLPQKHTGTITERKEQEWSQWQNMLQY